MNPDTHKLMKELRRHNQAKRQRNNTAGLVGAMIAGAFLAVAALILLAMILRVI